MASKVMSVPVQTGKVKLRFIEIELEGGDTTLLEGIKTVAAAINKGPTVRVLSVPAAPQINSAAQNVLSDADDEGEAEAEVPAQGTLPTMSVEEPRKRVPRAQSVPKFLEDLRLGEGPVTWKQFVEAHKLDTDLDKALAVLVWLRDERSVGECSRDHLFTCFRWLKWRTPGDIGQIFRNLKKDGLVKPTEPGLFSIAMQGQNRFDELRNGAS